MTDPSDRTQRRSRMYYSGMLTMDGFFKQSSRLALETYESVDASAESDWGELVRFRGHAHRFSLDLERASELYLEAMRSTSKGGAPALLGRLQTNLAETYCWYDPRRALGAAGAASEINIGLGNQIELGKCGAAKGIALAKLGSFDPARDAIATAIHLAEDVGYVAGVAFALQAKIVTEWLADDIGNAHAADSELAAVLEDLGTYAHLRAVPLLLLGDDDGFARSVSEVEWFEPDQLEARIARYLMP